MRNLMPDDLEELTNRVQEEAEKCGYSPLSRREITIMCLAYLAGWEDAQKETGKPKNGEED